MGEALSPLRFSFCEEKYHVHPQFAEFATTFTKSTVHNARYSWHLSNSVFLAAVPYLGTCGLRIFLESYDTSSGCIDCGSIVHALPIRYTLSLQHHHHSSDYKASFTSFSASPSCPGCTRLRICGSSLLSYFTQSRNLSFLIAFMYVTSAGILLYRTIRLKSTATKSKLRKLQAIGTLSIIIGCVLWNLDFALCRTLRTWRQVFGFPYRLSLEFHGSWHILTAVSGACFIEMVEGLRKEE